VVTDEKPKRPRCVCGKAVYESLDEAEHAACAMTRDNLRKMRSPGCTAARAYACLLAPCFHVTSKEFRSQAR
jgi:hypothetical protein